MTIPTTIPTGGHPADREMTELQKAVIAMLAGFASDILNVANGGTGLASYAAGDLIYATAATVLAKLAKQTNGQILTLAAGLPAWAGETAWTAPTLSGTWANSGGANLAAGYLKDASSFVHLRGNIKSGTIGTAAFTLPAGYRPSGDCLFAVNSAGAFGRVKVSSAGVVTPDVGNNAEVNLDGINFDTR